MKKTPTNPSRADQSLVVNNALNLATEICTRLNTRQSVAWSPDSLTLSLRQAPLYEHGEADIEHLSTLIARLDAIVADRPTPYPGAYHKAVSEIYEAHNTRIKTAKESLVAAVKIFRNKYALVPTLGAALSTFTHTADLSRATPHLVSEDAKDRQARRLSEATATLYSAVIAIVGGQTLPKSIDAGVLQNYISEYVIATEIYHSRSTIASDMITKTFLAEQSQAAFTLRHYINEGLYQALTKPRLNLVKKR